MKMNPLIKIRNLLARLLPLVVWMFGVFPTHAHADPFEYDWTELATGVWVGVQVGSMQWPTEGSTTFVVMDDGVIVYDGGGVPLMATRTIEKIKNVTDKPVTHVIISHWHGDHHLGIFKFRDAFPSVKFVGHPYTQAAILGETMGYIDGYPELIPNFIPKVKEYLRNNAYPSGKPLPNGARIQYEQLVRDAEIINEEFNRIRVIPPETLVKEKLVFESNTRRVEVLFLGKGNTKGDLILWLPEDKIVAVGDLVVHPIPFGSGSYPKEWAKTLNVIKNLKFETLVPGHGLIQTDSSYVDLLVKTLNLIAFQTNDFVAKGLTMEEAQNSLDISSLEKNYSKGDDFLASRLKIWFLKPIGEAAYKIEIGEPPEDIGD